MGALPRGVKTGLRVAAWLMAVHPAAARVGRRVLRWARRWGLLPPLIAVARFLDGWTVYYHDGHVRLIVHTAPASSPLP